jgi:hypothetical protein
LADVTPTHLVLLAIIFAAYVVGFGTCWFVLRRWQLGIMRREQGGEAPGFPVKMRERRE